MTANYKLLQHITVRNYPNIPVFAAALLPGIYCAVLSTCIVGPRAAHQRHTIGTFTQTVAVVQDDSCLRKQLHHYSQAVTPSPSLGALLLQNHCGSWAEPRICNKRWLRREAEVFGEEGVKGLECNTSGR